MSDDVPSRSRKHAFVVRIWWEKGLTRPNGCPLWRGEVEEAASGATQVFQSLDDLVEFIQSRSGVAGPSQNQGTETDPPTRPTGP